MHDVAYHQHKLHTHSPCSSRRKGVTIQQAFFAPRNVSLHLFWFFINLLAEFLSLFLSISAAIRVVSIVTPSRSENRYLSWVTPIIIIATLLLDFTSYVASVKMISKLYQALPLYYLNWDIDRLIRLVCFLFRYHLNIFSSLSDFGNHSES